MIGKRNEGTDSISESQKCNSSYGACYIKRNHYYYYLYYYYYYYY